MGRPVAALSMLAKWMARIAVFIPAALLGFAVLRQHASMDEPVDAVGQQDAARQALWWADLVPADWDPFKAWRGRDIGGIPDTDPQAQALLEEMKRAWSQAPTRSELDGRSVQLTGYAVPLEIGWGGLREFLLVPTDGACIHTPPPPANQIVHVRSVQPVKGLRAVDAVTVGGRLRVQHQAFDVGDSGYGLEAVHVSALR